MRYKPLSKKKILILVGLSVIGLTLYLLSFFAILPEARISVRPFIWPLLVGRLKKPPKDI